MRGAGTFGAVTLGAVTLGAAASLLSCGPPAGPLPATASDPAAEAEIRALFAEYLRRHAANDIAGWQALFTPEAVATEAAGDGSVGVYTIAELARAIAEEARAVEEQRETLDQERIETHGNAGIYAARYTLFQNARPIQTGRAYFSLVRGEGGWRIASLVWHRDPG